jgi:hypothetical protein
MVLSIEFSITKGFLSRSIGIFIPLETSRQGAFGKKPGLGRDGKARGPEPMSSERHFYRLD